MNILAVETSCDETSIAVVRDGRHVLSNVVASQIDLHRKYGGVVPELASRQHVLTVIPVLEEALQRARFSWVNIDAIAVTRGPGLSPALLVGVNAAKAMAFARQKPLLAVNHIEGHVYSNWLIPEADAAAGTPPPEPRFPALCLIVSGGHTELVLMSGHGQYKLLGKTIDDAAGEAFDKAARILGLGYPGGPAIEKAAQDGDPARFPFPRAWLKGTYDFSFSGLKTALLRKVQEYGVSAAKPAPWQRDQQPPPVSENTPTAQPNDKNQEGADRAPVRVEVKGEGGPDISSFRAEPAKTTQLPTPPAKTAPAQPPVPTSPQTDSIMERPFPVADLAASFQAAAVDALVEKAAAAAAEFGAREVLVAGGVAANAALRARLGERLKITFRYPPLVLCTDNAAMIAAAAYYRYAESVQRDFSLDIEPNARFV
ncbi:MAG TPA: tRNA (adenosine(37)-N6)-threonylcarbamoyltransferase complex transferase subunit TsaD [Chloroflexia bacterium]|nr:tRNA (adenosine(37)-N6)-threonylcarbamoyltransferase complex transferase subunit TsaD [Chloroflexia bacterium]